MDIRVPLYHKARTGAIHSWRVYVDGDTIYSEHGQVDGQKIVSSKVATPKNVGRSNETTAATQALIEAQAMWTFKRERKYSLSPDEAQIEVKLPMLAQDYHKHLKKLDFTVDGISVLDGQNKLDGVRARAVWQGGNIVLISRQGLPWEATGHLNKQLEAVLPRDCELDGEIYLHGKSLQWISSRTKKKQEGTELLEYHAYDMPVVDGQEGLPWTKRKQGLSTLFESMVTWAGSPAIKHVISTPVTSPEHAKHLHDAAVDAGYEGLIIRKIAAEYEYGFRSPVILKMKDFKDSEFIIVGHTDGKGKESGVVVWICKNDINDLTFETRPRGTYEDRSKLFDRAETYYGKELTVRFIGRNESGLPHHAIGHAIRLEEDM